MFALALWVRGQLLTDRQALAGFCQSTRGGELWARTLERARERGFDFVLASNSAQSRVDYLAIVDAFGTGLGCRITVEKGRVVATSFGDTGPR